jgi:hypothetical protein
MVRESVNARSWRLDRDKGKSFESLSFRGLREGRFTDRGRLVPAPKTADSSARVLSPF